ncbi:MAG: squalene--hopene cyclase [Verrucomicrobiaceae bacterium]|nr:squalene--hopene cyclase [Verrucomicrobiaceae bacterium]
MTLPIHRFFVLALCALGLPVTGAAQDSSIRLGNEIPPEVDTIYERGLAYLARTQSEDGSWRSRSEHGITGLCLMAFLAGGEDPNFGSHRHHIKTAIRSILLGQETDTGYFPNSMYHHGFAMLALAEAYGVVDEEMLWDGTEKEGTRRSIAEALELAIQLTVTAQQANRWGGWRYSPTSTDADTSVTGCVLMGLLACRNAGLTVPETVIETAITYMQRNTASSGFVAYSGGLGGGGESMARSAVATLVYAVAQKRESEEFPAALSHISERLDHEETAHTHYYYYYMAQALYQGNPVAWEQWNRGHAAMLAEQQASDVSFPGSYGEAYGTAMSLLSLALNYRFLPIYERF